ncbi:MAG TPA: CmcJ/NvfI family oxidoreductase [Vineibacter sp.]|nr:CmcJ/NvfI family oxidoreductase [Vineibacter sp.]
MASESVVHSTFNYTRDTGVAPEIYFYDPPAGAQARLPGDDPRDMAIHDGWDRAGAFSLDREGFALRDFRSPFDDWDDDTAIRERFYPEVIAFLRTAVGARRVVIFDHTIRTKANTSQQTAEHTTTQRAPVMLVHCDYTPRSGPLRVRQLLPDEADELLKRRVAFYNVWKPIRHRVEEKPLAVCDVTSSVQDDFITMALRYRERDGEIFVMRHAPQHRWWYFPGMTPEQVLLLKTYDSETDGRARFLGHSAFDHPATPPDARVRESIEIRTIAFF